MQTSTKSQNFTDFNSELEKPPFNVAVGRLADARRWFGRRFWKELPQNDRGRKILMWGADHAWLACPTNPQKSVRRWCRKYYPRLTDAELDQIVADTKVSNKRWSHDQCATVLGITARVGHHLGFRFIGACDDPDYRIRRELRREKAAERSRKYRATRSTGGTGGRPALQLSDEVKLARRREQDAARARRYRASRKTPSRDIIDNRKRDAVKRDAVKRDAVSVSHPKKSKTDIGVSAPALSGKQTKDPIGSVSDIPTDDQSLAGLPIEPEGSITHADFDEEPIGSSAPSPSNAKTRVRSTYWPTRRQRELAAEHGIPPDRIENLFATFTYSNLATGAYSADWDAEWGKYVAKSIILDEEQQRRERAIAYFARKDGAASDADRSYIDPRL